MSRPRPGVGVEGGERPNMAQPGIPRTDYRAFLSPREMKIRKKRKVGTAKNLGYFDAVTL